MGDGLATSRAILNRNAPFWGNSKAQNIGSEAADARMDNPGHVAMPAGQRGPGLPIEQAVSGRPRRSRGTGAAKSLIYHAYLSKNVGPGLAICRVANLDQQEHGAARGSLPAKPS